MELAQIGLSQVYWRSRTGGETCPTDASSLTWKAPVTAYIFFGSLGCCPVSQTIIWLNKIFMQYFYK